MLEQLINNSVTTTVDMATAQKAVEEFSGSNKEDAVK
jgi:hypothetical protein